MECFWTASPSLLSLSLFLWLLGNLRTFLVDKENSIFLKSWLKQTKIEHEALLMCSFDRWWSR